MNLEQYLNSKTQIINQYLDQNLLSVKSYPPEIYRAMRYSVFAGGKRIRPILTIATAEISVTNINNVIPTAAALELIHTYSLIHDDLPSMDNDDYRRGKPTNHKVFGEATAILAGNALLLAAFDFIAKSRKKYRIADAIISQVIVELGIASGYAGMVGGQIVDLESENKKINSDTLHYIHTHKTGALICHAVRLGAILTSVSNPKLDLLTKFGNSLGLMFQITDDILDEMDNRTQLKKIGKRDRARGKATYPSVYGLEESRRRVERLLTDVDTNLKPFGKRAALLKAIAGLVANRIN
ncbi:MAG: polyprenyl synthetase family protein [bacterium]